MSSRFLFLLDHIHCETMRTLALLLLLHLRGCGGTLETREASAGETVRLECPLASGYFNWMRLVPGDVPEVFPESSRTYNQIYIIREENEEEKKLILELKSVRENDSAVYVCLKIIGKNWTFTKRVKLIVTEPSVNQSTPAATVPSPTTPPANWACFPPGKFQSQPSFVHVEGAQEYNCEGDQEGPSARKCLFSFFMNVSLSNTTGFGSVAWCGERTQQGAEANESNSTQHYKVHVVMSVALTVSLMCIAVLLHSIKKLKSQLRSRGVTELQDGVSDAHQDPSTHSVIYATNLRFQNRADGKGRRKTNRQEDQCVYSAVKKHRSRKYHTTGLNNIEEGHMNK